MQHWHLVYRGKFEYISSDLDCTKPYWNKTQAKKSLNQHNSNCTCREVSIKECDDLMCVVKGLE